jgi:hypothetical protein
MRSAVCIDIPVVIKARTDAGRRLVECEVSNEKVDSEGDVILQKALLNSAESFLKRGHVDLDHLSEIGASLNPPIKDPESYIVGRPVTVKDLGEGRTGVVTEIFRSADGVSRPEINRFDAFWESLQKTPPVVWRASIYGFPLAGEVEDCSKATCSTGAARWLVKGLDWRSLAFTRTPVNDNITGYAQIVAAKSWVGIIAKSRALSKIADAGSQLPTAMMYAETMNDNFAREITPSNSPLPGSALPVLAESQPSFDEGNAQYIGEYLRHAKTLSREGLWGDYEFHVKRECPHCADGVNVSSLSRHYAECKGLPRSLADLSALALMHLINRHNRRNRK